MKLPFFDLGQTVITEGAHRALSPDSVLEALNRYVRADWGELCAEDKATNDEALLSGRRLFGAYKNVDQTMFWIITESDRSTTTVLLPDEY